MKLLKTIFSLTALVFLTNGSAQTVFSESFDEGDGAIAGTDDLGGVPWTSSCPFCVSGDYWEIVGGLFEGNDTNGPATWETTADIDISSCDKFTISIDISEVGVFEPCGMGCDATDWIMLEYSIDGGAWTTPVDATFCAGDCADVSVIHSDDVPDGSMTYETPCIPGGSTLRIRISVQCWAGSEYWQIDNVGVNCSDLPTIDAGPDQVVCDGESVTLTADNPDGADLSWSGGVTDGVGFVPPAGTTTTFTVTGIDPIGGCTSTDEVDITSIPPPTASIDAAGPFTTASSSESTTAFPPGGIWSASCGACIDATTGEFDPSAAGPGFHEVCYTVGVDPCEDSACTIFEVIDAGGGPCSFVGVLSSGAPTCYGFSDGSVTVDVTGGTTPFTFIITNEDGDVVNADNSNTANSLPEGWYSVEVTDASGCTILQTLFIDDPDSIIIDLQLIHPLCHGDETGIALVDSVLNAQGDYDEIVYLWSPDPSSSSGLDGDSASVMAAGNYTLTVNDDLGCSQELQFEIVEPEPLVFSELGYEPALCRLYAYQVGNGQVYAAGVGGTPDYTYQWENLETAEVSVNTTWGGLNPGNYQMTLTDANGCSIVQVVTADSLNPVADFSVFSNELDVNLSGTSTVCVEFENGSNGFALASDPLADTSGWWNFDYPNTPWVLYNDSVGFFQLYDTCYDKGGVYEVCLRIQNKNGCRDSVCKEITVYDPLTFVPVNVFTPDGDGVNDVFSFELKSVSVAEFRATVFNRWGNTVFDFTSITDGWNGETASGRKCRDGVYFYIYEGVAENGEPFSGQGTVQLISAE